MKIIKLAIMLMLLLGCTLSESVKIDSIIEDTLLKVEKTEPLVNQDHKKQLFSYYLPQNIGVKKSNEISSVLNVDNYEVFMTLEVSDILNKEFRKVEENKEDFVFTKNFLINNVEEEEKEGQLIIEKLAEDQFLLYVKIEEIIFLSALPKAAIATVFENMLVVARSVEVDKKLVIAQFSNKEEINYQQQVIELFSESVPTDGFLKDIYVNEKEDE